MPRRALRIVGRVIAVILCCLSVPLCAAAAFLWVRGYRTVDVFEAVDLSSRSGHSTQSVYRVSSGRGVLAFNYVYRFSQWYPWPRGAAPPADFQSRRYARATLRPYQFRLLRRTFWQRRGFYLHSDEQNGHYQDGRLAQRNIDWGFRVPCWLVVAPTAVLPVIYVRRLGRLRRHYRSRRGLCPGCGYDLRASRERCPECGETIVAPPASLSAMGVAT